MKILMLGWEFPPFFAGGIGIVCYELSRALASQGVEITYLMPFGPRDVKQAHLKNLIIAENVIPNVKIKTIPTTMHAYMSTEEYHSEMKELSFDQKDMFSQNKKLYGKHLMEEVHRFAHRAMEIASREDFDIIHCHDWMTIPAAVGIKQHSGKPLVVHIHNTIYDRYLSGSNKVEYDIEQLGLDNADSVICVSHFVKDKMMENYSVDKRKVRVIHNAAQEMNDSISYAPRIKETDKIVLFAGRITMQKGPEYFIRAARLVADHDPNVKFVMAGSGDMLSRMIELAADLRLSDRFLFPGFYSREDAEKLFAMADVFVMPSVSEPFGVVPLEAMYKNTPTIISRQSGVSEVLNHVLKVDFWDVSSLAEKILSVLRYEALHNELQQHGAMEVKQLTWDAAATQVKATYQHVLPLQVVH